MSKRQHAASVSYDEWVAKALHSDPEFAVEYLKQAMEAMNDPGGRGAALLALRQIAESCGGVAKA
jgi:hypothetical protein